MEYQDFLIPLNTESKTVYTTNGEKEKSYAIIKEIRKDFLGAGSFQEHGGLHSMDNLQISAHLELTSFIRSAWMRNGACHQGLMMDLFEVLVRAGCDFFDLLDLYSDHIFSEIDLGVFAKQSPMPKTILPITPQNIRGSIFRWSGSRYHTDCISKIVDDIYRSLLLGKSGISVYNSNQNPRSRQSLNDKYILLIVKDENLFFDISRKSTVKFQKE